jgi:hypothetical protein
MLLGGAEDGLVRIATAISSAKTVAVTIGMALLVGALVAKIGMRKARARPVVEP